MRELENEGQSDEFLRILSEVMREGDSDKSTDLYLKYRKFDSTLRDKLYPALNRIGLGDGPDAVRFGRQMLARIETACRFPELTRMALVQLVPPFINEAFQGNSLGLIKPIPALGSVRTTIPVLAIHGPDLKIEYVNYADCRREISVKDYSHLIKWSHFRYGFRLGRLIKNFIVTAPEVTSWAAVLVLADRYENVPIAERLSMFRGQSFFVSKMSSPVKVNPSSIYLGLREQFDWLGILVRASLLREEKTAKRIIRAVTEDRTRLMHGDGDGLDIFEKYQQEAKAVVKSCNEHLGELQQILNEAQIYLEDIRHILHDVYNVHRENLKQRFKRLPSSGKMGGPNIVVWCLCRIIETYLRSGSNPKEWFSRLEQFGIDPNTPVVQKAVQNGKELASEHFIDSDELVRDGEEKIKARRSQEPLKATDVQLVPYKMAAAFGNLEALSRLSEIFYECGRYAHGRRLTSDEEIAEAKALKYVLNKLVYKGVNVPLNRKRINHLRTCLGEFDTPEIKYRKSSPRKENDSNIWNFDDYEINEYDEDESYEETSECVDHHTSSGCFVVTAAIKALNVSRYAAAKAFLSMKRLRDERMLENKRGRVLLSAYYRVAPTLVNEIDSCADAARIYRSIWEMFIVPACEAVGEGDLSAAERIYSDMVERLLFTPIESLEDV